MSDTEDYSSSSSAGGDDWDDSGDDWEADVDAEVQREAAREHTVRRSEKLATKAPDNYADEVVTEAKVKQMADRMRQEAANSVLDIPGADSAAAIGEMEMPTKEAAGAVAALVAARVAEFADTPCYGYYLRDLLERLAGEISVRAAAEEALEVVQKAVEESSARGAAKREAAAKQLDVGDSDMAIRMQFDYSELITIAGGGGEYNDNNPW